MLLDKNKLHTKKVKEVNGPQKQFNTKDGTKEKYQVIFEDGYTAEYCPLLGTFDTCVAAGKMLTFRIGYRSGNHPDEIEPAFVPVQDQTNPGAGGGRVLANMHSHPAVISLNAAIRYHAEIKKDSSKELSDILADAEEIRDWLDKQANIDSL